MTSADIPAGMRLKDLAGWNQTKADWDRFLSASPEGCFVAEVDRKVRGTAATIAYEERFAWIGMVLVDPEYRGRGLGTRLLEEAIRHLDAREVPTMKLDATPQGKPIYQKLGFMIEYEIERWMLKRSKPDEAPNAAKSLESQFKRPEATQAQLDPIPLVDREIFGADRSFLLGSLHREAPEFTLAEPAAESAMHVPPTTEASIAAYALGRRGSRADHLGPWVARDATCAKSVLDQFLARSGRETVLVDCMKSNPFACELLRAAGFEFSRPLTRMYRGENAHPGRPELVCAALGPEFG